MNSVIKAFNHFAKNYFHLWQETHSSLPQTELYLDLPSPCVVQQTHYYVLWQIALRETLVDFANIEQALNLKIHQDIKSFYGSRYCADMKAKWQNLSLELLQVWSDEDLERLQKNIIGHLLMQKKLRQKPTIFIATTDDNLNIISLCNQTGQILKERIGTNEREILAFSLSDFLEELTPKI